MTLLVDFGRELGLPLRGLHFATHVGWTTDGAKAETMRRAGAKVQRYAHRGWDGGYEISFPQGAEVLSPSTGTAA